MRIHLITKVLLTLAGVALAPVVWAAATGGSASPSPDGPAAGAVLDVSTSVDAVDSAGRAADSARKAAAAAKADAATRALPDAPVNANNISTGNGASANSDSINAAYKDLVKSAGVQNTLQDISADLSLDKARQALDAGSDEEIEAARKARASGDTAASMRTTAAPRTEEQQRQDEARASLMAAQLLDEVAPWVGGAVVLYVSLKIARYVFLRNREKAARRRRHRHRRSTVRSS